MPTPVNRQIVLRSRPVGMPKPGDFDLVESPLPAPKDGEILSRTITFRSTPTCAAASAAASRTRRGWSSGR